jgi:hypothetical protein
LDLFLAIAMKNPNLRFEITAHTDERGTVAYNQALSERRLESVLAYIRERGLDMSRVIPRAAGLSEPMIKGARYEEEHALNRRTTIVIFDPNIVKQPRRTMATDVKESKPSNQKGLWFRVQVGTFRSQPRYAQYFFRDQMNAVPGTDLVYFQDVDGFFKYTLGDYQDLEQIRRLQQRILNIGKEATIIAFLDGKSITLAEAEALLNRE